MTLTRRELLEVAAMLAFAGPAAGQKADDHVEAAARRAADVIRAYSAEGFHRTGSSVDRASGDRLLSLACATGASARLESFELSRVDPVAAFFEVDGRRLDGLPMFDGTFTDAAGVRGAIGATGVERPIAFTKIAPNGEVALRRVREGSPYRAIVVATMGDRPGLCPVNAASFKAPFGPPVLQISSEHLEAVEHAVLVGRDVRVVAQVARQTTEAFNVVADVTGTDPRLPPVCVMTPRSGWHANASERGGGLACWMETLRAVVAAHGPAEAGHDVQTRPLRTVKFVASSGHELGHLGLHAYLKKNPTLAHEAVAWIHLGANIGTSTGDTAMTPSDESLAAAALHALGPHGLDKTRRTAATQVGGEATTISQEGGRFVSFIGRNAWFHNPGDLWPDVVDIQTVGRFARAISDLTLALANTPA